MLEKISEVYETKMEVLGLESKRPHETSGSGPRHVIDHSRFRILLQNDSFVSQDLETQPSVKPHPISKKPEKPVAAGPVQHSRNNVETLTRGFKHRYALLADHSRKAADLKQARLAKMQTESYIQRLGAQSAPESKLIRPRTEVLLFWAFIMHSHNESPPP